MANYFAQTSNGNITSNNMWNTAANGSGTAVTLALGANGVAGFYGVTGDAAAVLIANNKGTIVINANVAVLELRNDTTGGATGGGAFSIGNGGLTINANIFGDTANVTMVTCNTNDNLVTTINGNLSLGISQNQTCLTIAGSSRVNIFGNITGGGVNGGSPSNGINHGSTGALNITGNLFGAFGGWGLVAGGTGVVTVNGNIYGQLGSNTGSALTTLGLANAFSNVIVNGNIIGGTAAAGTHGAIVNGQAATASLVINGNVTGGSNSPGLTVVGGATATVNGTVIGGVGAVGANITSTGIVYIKRAKGNSFGPGSWGVTSQVGVSAAQTSNVRVEEIEYGEWGQSPTSGPIILTDVSSNSATFSVRNSLPKTLVDSSNVFSLIPTSGNVRSGVIYNLGNSSGTCAVPHPNSVVYGVPVNNTTGSGLINSQAVWNVLPSNISTSGSIGQRLKNCSTIATVGKQLEGAL